MHGEKYFLLDLVAFAVLILRMNFGGGDVKGSSSKIYHALILFTLIWNLDLILTLEVWKLKKQVWLI